MNITKKEIDKIIALIYKGFTWEDTDQGHDYWKKVIENLRDIRGGKTSEKSKLDRIKAIIKE